MYKIVEYYIENAIDEKKVLIFDKPKAVSLGIKRAEKYISERG